MHHPNDRRLFDFIHSIGDVFNYRGIICIENNNGPNAGENNHYIVFVKGGILFEISREKSEKEEWEYFITIQWRGPWEAKDATDILAALTVLNHGKIQQGAAAGT